MEPWSSTANSGSVPASPLGLKIPYVGSRARLTLASSLSQHPEWQRGGDVQLRVTLGGVLHHTGAAKIKVLSETLTEVMLHLDPDTQAAKHPPPLHLDGYIYINGLSASLVVW